jgi:hypothetical protein
LLSARRGELRARELHAVLAPAFLERSADVADPTPTSQKKKRSHVAGRAAGSSGNSELKRSAPEALRASKDG